MSLENFITAFLNINPESIQELSHIIQSDNSILIKLKLKPQIFTCPFCKGKIKIHGYYPRKLNHSTFANRICFIHYLQRRFKCEACEYTFHENNPFINSRENITYETKINVLKDLKFPEATYTSVATRYNLSVQRVLRIFDKHVDIPRKSLPEVLSMDEHYFPESDYDSLYCCLLMNFLTGEIIDILPDRKKTYLEHYFSYIKKDTLNHSTKTSELNNVKYISIDLYENFKNVAITYFPNAIICADSFHVTKHLTDAFRKVRLRCRRETENKDLKYFLSTFKYVFHNDTYLDNEPKYNKRLNQYINLRGIRDMMFSEFPELKTAYELKQYYLRLNSSCTYEQAPAAIDTVINMFADCGIEEYDDFYTLLTNWKTEIINSFIEINGRRINNSYIESKNRLLEKLIYNANGFTNFKRTRNRILYCLNKNDNFKI